MSESSQLPVHKGHLFKVTVCVGASYYVMAQSLSQALELFNTYQRQQHRPRKAQSIGAVCSAEYFITERDVIPDEDWDESALEDSDFVPVVDPDEEDN